MESATVDYWAMRTEMVETLFNDDELFLAEKEARSLLKEPMLPRYYRIHCLVLLAQCLKDWHQAKYYQGCAEQIWRRMRLLWPVETLSSDDNSLMDELRTMLDELEEDMIADKPENADYAECLDGVVVYRLEPPEEEEENVEVADQQQEESEDEEEEDEDETIVIKPGVEFGAHDLPLRAPESNPSRSTNRESLSTEQSIMWSDTDKSKARSSGILSSLGDLESPLKRAPSSMGDFESPVKRQQTPLSFRAIGNVPDSTPDFDLASRLRQRDAAASPTPGQSRKKTAAIPGPSVSQPRQVQDRNIALPGPSIQSIIEKEDTKVDKPKMIPRDVPDKPKTEQGVASGKGKDMHITEMLRSGPQEEALKSRPPSPTKIRHSASIRSSRSRPSSFFGHTAPAAPVAAEAAHVSVQAESSRSRYQPMSGMAQSGIARSQSTPLLSSSQTAGPLKDSQTAAQESLRSSLRDSLNSGWTSLKSSTSSTIGNIGTIGRSLTHRSRRRPDSTAGSEVGDVSQEGSTAGRDRRHKRKKDKKSPPTLNTLFEPPRK
ncbi:hypothetical protein KCU95_g10827, partial [Aureobasidium melanogenum]